MRRRFAVAALAACSLLFPALAESRLSAPQRFFRAELLKDRGVSSEIKAVLRGGGFVDPEVEVNDLTGEGKSDAVVLVDSGGSAGRIALYVFSAGRAERLRLVYRNQRLYRAAARVSGSSVFYETPLYEAGDDLCCPSAVRETELRWNARRKRFVVAGRRTIERRRHGAEQPAGGERA